MQEQLQEILLEQLRDVHTPPAIGWWPLAPAWWMLAFTILCAVGFAVYVLLKRRARNRYRYAALSELETAFAHWQNQQSDSQYLQSANAILRRCMRHLQPNEQLITLTGESWGAALNRCSPQAELSPATQQALSYECYKAQPNVDTNAINQELCNWIKSHQAIPQVEPDDLRLEVSNA